MNLSRKIAMVVGLAALAVGGAAGPVGAAGPKANATGTVTEYTMPDTEQARPWDLTLGPDGNMWFTTGYGREVGRVTPTGQITEFPVPVDPYDPYILAIVSGPDGALWFSVQDNGVYRMTTDGVITNHYTMGSNGDGMTVGPDGNLWAAGRNVISRITPAGGVTDFPVDGYSLRITAGPDGNLWFTDTADFYLSSSIGRITPTGEVTMFPVDMGGDPTLPWGITAGPDGNIWYADQFSRIGRVTTGGVFTTFPAPESSIPTDITAGPDGNLWFTAFQIGRVVRMTTSGQPTGFALPAPYSGPYNIAAGPHNTVWFTEQGANNIPYNKIGVIKTCGSTCNIQSK